MTQLKVIQPGFEPPLFRSSAADVRLGDGFYPEEHDDVSSFRWMGASARLDFTPAPVDRWLEARVLTEFRDLSQHLRLAVGDGTIELPLPTGWNPISVSVPAGVASIALSVNKIFPREYYPGDARDLSIRVREVHLHADPERHAVMRHQYDNACLNQRETMAGQVVLASTPPKLGIDLHGACNVKPPCVYCEWEFSKEIEGDNVDVPFTRDTLREWGPFFDNSQELVNCSIGEPFMMRNLNELFDIFGRTGKVLQMTTNGQILTEHNVRKLLGLDIELYVSLDAATPETYAKLRNNTFDKILVNLRRLVAAKGGRGKPPYLHVVFMPMRCNVHELEAFVRLCADLEVDRLVLRPLNYSDSTTLDWERSGYHFEYHNELLSFADLVRASGRAARLSERLGVPLSDQMDFGGSMRDDFQAEFEAGRREADAYLAAAGPAPAEPPVTAPSAPPAPVAEAPAVAAEPVAAPASAALPSLGEPGRAACLEPWKSLYILRRGVLPCCYGGKAIAPMEDHAQAWNSPLMQAIRGKLIAGEFHEYCLESPACPIVRKQEQAQKLAVQEMAVVQARHLYGKLNRTSGGRIGRWGVRPLRRTAARARAAVSRLFARQ